MNATIHKQICDEMNALYIKKNSDYNDSFARTRNRIPFYTLGKLADKYERLENLMLNGAEANYESIEDTLLDLANYCVMELTERYAERAIINEHIEEIEINLDDLDETFDDLEVINE